MRKTLSYTALVLFALYWGFTLLFVTPQNYISISFLEGEKVFNTFLYQKWGFFAPPPKYNDRLYYTFQNKHDTIKKYTFEVMAPLQHMKADNAPFNSGEDILDYVLSSTIHSINDGLIAVNEAIDYQIDTNKMKQNEGNDHQKIERGKLFIQETSYFKTLKNYSRFIASKNNLNIDDYFVTIEVAQIKMPKFADREELGKEDLRKESLLFKSDKFTLTTR